MNRTWRKSKALPLDARALHPSPGLTSAPNPTYLSDLAPPLSLARHVARGANQADRIGRASGPQNQAARIGGVIHQAESTPSRDSAQGREKCRKNRGEPPWSESLQTESKAESKAESQVGRGSPTPPSSATAGLCGLPRHWHCWASQQCHPRIRPNHRPNQHRAVIRPKGAKNAGKTAVNRPGANHCKPNQKPNQQPESTSRIRERISRAQPAAPRGPPRPVEIVHHLAHLSTMPRRHARQDARLRKLPAPCRQFPWYM
jgi:hypothetical protein